MNSETSQPSPHEKVYTAQDMLRAFRHGVEYEHLNTKGDFDYRDVDEKNWPFWEWLQSLAQASEPNNEKLK